MADLIQLRRDREEYFIDKNPVLRSGEVVVVYDNIPQSVIDEWFATHTGSTTASTNYTNFISGYPYDQLRGLKIGNGVDDYNSLPLYHISRTLNIELTYAELKALVDDKLLHKGALYTITDFQTIHIIPNTNALNVQGVTYENKADWVMDNREGVEPLTLTAISENAFNYVVISKTYEKEIIHYDFNNNKCEDGVTPRKGAIIYRRDPSRNVETFYDWRKVKFRRWKIKPQDWVSGTTYGINAVVEYNNYVYASMITGNTSTPSLTNSSWFPFWDFVQQSWGFPSRYVSCFPTNCLMGNYNVPAVSNDFIDYFTFNAFKDATSTYADNGEFSPSIVTISLGKVSSPTTTVTYNNIIFVGHKQYTNNVFVKIIKIDHTNTNMTFPNQAEQVYLGPFSDNNIFRKPPYQMNIEKWFRNNCFARESLQCQIPDDFTYNNIGVNGAFHSNFIANIQFTRNKFNGHFRWNNIGGYRSEYNYFHLFQGTTTTTMRNNTFYGTVTDSTFTTVLQAKTFNSNMNALVVSKVSSDGTVWSMDIDDDGSLITTTVS